jgi:tetratricopeptide (TPR) repeat protein
MLNRKRIFVMIFSMGMFLHAGITDFKTIEKATKAYEDKAYTKSASLLKSLDAKSPQKQYDLGNALYKSKNYDEALEAYEKAEGIDEATRLHNIGNSHFQKQELDKAIEA